MSAHVIALGLLLDRIIGDPPNWTHQVQWIGRFILKLTTLVNKGSHRKIKGDLTVNSTELV